MLHLTQLQGGAGGAEAISPDLDINLAAFEASLRNYLDADDTQQPFDVVSQASFCVEGQLDVPSACLPQGSPV